MAPAQTIRRRKKQFVYLIEVQQPKARLTGYSHYPQANGLSNHIGLGQTASEPKARRTRSSRPEGLPVISRGLEGPLVFYNAIHTFHSLSFMSFCRSTVCCASLSMHGASQASPKYGKSNRRSRRSVIIRYFSKLCIANKKYQIWEIQQIC